MPQNAMQLGNFHLSRLDFQWSNDNTNFIFFLGDSQIIKGDSNIWVKQNKNTDLCCLYILQSQFIVTKYYLLLLNALAINSSGISESVISRNWWETQYLDMQGKGGIKMEEAWEGKQEY